MKPARARVFDETYNSYLSQIREMDFLAKAESLGVEVDDGALQIPLYDTIYSFSKDGITGFTSGEVQGETRKESEHLTPAVRVMICKYILTCPRVLPQLDGRFITYREFKDSGPLVSNFTNNTNKTLESAFSGNIRGLKQASVGIGGEVLDSETYDFSVRFHAFPRIPVFINFNDQDEMFPAGCSVLYHRSADLFLDMECLAMTGTLLAGKLLRTLSLLEQV